MVGKGNKRHGPAFSLSVAKRPRTRAPHVAAQSAVRSRIVSQIQALAKKNWESKKTLSDRQVSPSQTRSTISLVYKQYICTEHAEVSLTSLDATQYLQNLLWPEFCRLSHSSPGEAPCPELLFSIVALFNHRCETHPDSVIDILALLDEDLDASQLFCESLFCQTSAGLSPHERCARTTFLTKAFRTLDHLCFRNALLPLVSLPVWIHLSEDSRREQLELFPHLRKPLSKLTRRARRREKSDSVPSSERAVFSLVRELEGEIASLVSDPSRSSIRVAGSLLNLFTEMLSQRRTRHILLPLLQDRSTLPIVQAVTVEIAEQAKHVAYEVWSEWMRIVELFAFYVTFPVDPVTGAAANREAMWAESARRLLVLQITAHVLSRKNKFPGDHPLTMLAVRAQNAINSREYLSAELAKLSENALQEIRKALGLRQFSSLLQLDSKEKRDEHGEAENGIYRRITIGSIAAFCGASRDAFESFRRAPVMLQELDLWGPQGAQEASSSAALPTLNLEFLDMRDYLLRNFTLYKWEVALAIRQELEEAIVRLRPRVTQGVVSYGGSARVAVPISEVRVVDIGHVVLDTSAPTYVKVEVDYDVTRYSGQQRREWENVRPYEVLFLVKFQLSDLMKIRGDSVDQQGDLNLLLSSCTVRGVSVMPNDSGRHMEPRQRERDQRTLVGLVDSKQFYLDSGGEGIESDRGKDVFQDFNILVRLQAQVSHFLPFLNAIRDVLLASRPCIPPWLEQGILGHRIPLDRSEEVGGDEEDPLDFVDTFLSDDHVRASFPSANVVFKDDDIKQTGEGHTGYNIRAVQVDAEQMIEVEPYIISHGLATAWTRRASYSAGSNATRFNPTQTQAIKAAMSPGITLIAGLPGTGKTSCMVQIVSNLYHGSPQERILVVTRTNHVLNEVLKNILSRNIDPLRILRLGQGGDMAGLESLSCEGRINALLKRRLQLLSSVAELSASLNGAGFDRSAEDWSCESADDFNRAIVRDAWKRFMESDNQEWGDFPFKNIFEKNGADSSTDPLEAYSAVVSLFEELDELGFLEVLREQKQRGDYVTMTHARVVAMTATSAAIQRAELMRQGFSYDTLIMEEASDALEAESFVAFSLQRPAEVDQPDRLKRVVFVGDDSRTSAFVENQKLHRKCNLGQSMFARLGRCGNRVYRLTHQGRARKSIADLYRWRYPNLKDMDHMESSPLFLRANPGLRYAAQFVDVGEESSETRRSSHSFQNLVEAEYVAFVFIYMRLLGYPSEGIVILTTCTGQVEPLKDVLGSRLQEFAGVGGPCRICTVDKFRGQQADYVLLSLVRTESLGYMKDPTRIATALSRARYGVYLFGYLPLYENCDAFERVLEKLAASKKLALVANETFGECDRTEKEVVGEDNASVREVHSPAEMAKIVSHVYEMLKSDL